MPSEALSLERGGESEISSTSIVMGALGAVLALVVFSGFLTILVMLFGAAIGWLLGMGIASAQRAFKSRQQDDAEDSPGDEHDDERVEEDELVL